MPAKKKVSTTKKKAVKKSVPKKPVPRKKIPRDESAPTTSDVMSSGQMVFNQIMPYLLMCLALFITVCYMFTSATGFVGAGLRSLMYGSFSGGAVILPLLIINIAVFWRRDRDKRAVRYRLLFSLICQIFISILIHIFTGGGDSFADLWANGLEWSGGGLIGGFLGAVFLKGIGNAGTLIVSFSVLIIFGLYLFGLTPYSIGVWIAFQIHEYKDRRAAERLVIPPRQTAELPVIVDNRDMPVDIPIDDEIKIIPDFFDDETQIEVIKSERKRRGKTAEDIEGELRLDEIFADDFELLDVDKFKEADGEEDIDVASIDLEVERQKVNVTPSRKSEPNAPPSYVFPPLTLLNIDNSPKNSDISEELETTGRKLVATLASFKVRTRITHISRGPTITRYELAPEEGVPVKSIANRVDDISLHLATSGVRIEAPIPGKSAVGIEVPNRIVSTVYLRELIENQKFKAAQSKITVSLGVDVAGDPVYLDIERMPHLLIAGATGSGKSISTNCMIVSLLYKSNPDDVKMILVDPKRVEFNIYNGLPHLLVPVVSDSKKAAGALHWAVTEMERRYEIFEPLKTRNIQGYNAIAAENPEFEKLPQIVIIIDELADLMMTAPDDVEDSICRLAQKARAAGMYLILATQRPSVNVITGLIKANIPSRISFTVASQIDSRIILDMSGAEKLIGRGDMLYSPTGAMKSIRVQGAYISDPEVERVVDFIKRQGHEAKYDDEVMESIERAAEEFENDGKKSAFEDDGETDAMLKPAIELALESGKISTSLIQRRLQLGYGRAAKLIDIMEQRGYVSPPEGQKPRNVLITRQQYMEMVLSKDEF